MTRNTHDLELDHHGAFDAADFAEQGSNPASPPAGQMVLFAKTDGFYAKDSAGTVVGPLGEGGGGGGLLDLVTGDSQHFDAGLGDWVNTGGTLSRDTTYKMWLQTASLKFAVTEDTHRVDLPIAGTFLAGHDYYAVVWLSNESTTGTFRTQLLFGLIGTDNEDTVVTLDTTKAPWIGDTHFVAVAIHWKPTADRTGVSFRLKAHNANDTTWHIGMFRVWETPVVGQIDVKGTTYLPLSHTQQTTIVTPFSITNTGLNLTIDGRAWLYNGGMDSGLYLSKNYYGPFSEHTPGDKVQEGYNLEVGNDYLGFYIGQKNADTVQFYADWDDFNFEFEDGAVNGWKFVPVDGTTAAWPAKGMLPQYATAPSSPVEGQSYYDTALHKSRTWDGSAWQNWW